MFQEGVASDFFLPSTRSRGGPVMESFTEQLRLADGGAMSSAVSSVLIDREPLASRMQGIAAPTLFIAGRFDTLYPAETLRRAAAKLPDGRFVVLDTAHISVVDAPAQTTATIDDFLASLPTVLPRQAP
jgi:3-oxoadipate enol-lactonase